MNAVKNTKYSTGAGYRYGCRRRKREIMRGYPDPLYGTIPRHIS
jgi:hypothetical protein